MFGVLQSGAAAFPAQKGVVGAKSILHSHFSGAKKNALPSLRGRGRKRRRKWGETTVGEEGKKFVGVGAEEIPPSFFPFSAARKLTFCDDDDDRSTLGRAKVRI